MLFTALIALLVGAGVAFSTAFTIQRWWQWQHVIGALGGAVLVLPVFLMLQLYYDSDAMAASLIIFFIYCMALLWLLSFVSRVPIIVYWAAGWIIFSFVWFGIKMVRRRYPIAEFSLIVLGIGIGILSLVMVFFKGNEAALLHLLGAVSSAVLTYGLIVYPPTQPFLLGVSLITLGTSSLRWHSFGVYQYWIFGVMAAAALSLFIWKLVKKQHKIAVVFGIELVAAIVGIVLNTVLVG